MTNENIREGLNNLIETCKDGQDGFKAAAEAVENTMTKTMFYDLSQQRSQFAGELQTLVRGLGGEPEDDGSFAAKVHRGWIDIKSAITGGDEGAILNECERGEDAAVKAYKEFLENDVPSDISATVTTQYEAVKTAHDRVKAQRDKAKAATS